ncbi:MAG: hypothetical protein ACKOZU_08160 [Planctomycetaceae bacterium]
MEFDGFGNGLLIILVAIVAAILLVALGRSLYPAEKLRQSHDLTGNLLSVVGTLYAVLLGLVVVDAMVRFEHGIDVVQEESNSLADIFLLADRLPEPQRASIREACKTYARQVVDLEWPLMARGQVSGDARRTAFTIVDHMRDFEPVTESQKAIYPMILAQIQELWDCRRERTGTATTGIPLVEWFVLIAGAAVTVLFAGLFSAQSVSLQRFLTALTAMIIGLNLYLVSLFGYPFAGELTVSSRPFAIDIAIFEGRFTDGPPHAQERPAN